MENLRLFDLLHNLQKFPEKKDALAVKEDGQWRTYSTTEYISIVNNLSLAFLKLGLKRGDKIGLISNNRPEWNFVDYACLQTGVINTPLYPTISDHDLKHVLHEAEIQYFFVSSSEIAAKVRRCTEDRPLKEIFCFTEGASCRTLKELVQQEFAPELEVTLEQIKHSIRPEDLATIIYTSGTTGNPKGVMLSHLNFISNVEGTKDLCPFTSEWRALSFLPLNHVYERMLSYLYISRGVSVYYAESLDTIARDLKEVRPQIFVTVPRLLEKVYEKIVNTGSQLKGVKKGLFFWALNLGLRYEQFNANGWWYEMQLRLANKLIFSKWREALGGNIQAVVSGGSALQIRLARVFHAAGIRVLEGYGLTETSPVIAVNVFDEKDIRIGTVGPVLKNVQVRLAEDGEIYVKGNNVMMGYYKQPGLTAEAIDAEGWLHTGDIGVFIEDRFLKITDRKKEMFKTSGGKYITPQFIENRLKESRFIEQAIVVGENEKHPAALIVPAFAFLKQWCEKRKIAFDSPAAVIRNPEVKERISKEIAKINEDLAQYEKIKKFELLAAEWTIDQGELTPKLSLKRKIILQNNQDTYKLLYKSNAI